jgi:hypothetical protein
VETLLRSNHPRCDQLMTFQLNTTPTHTWKALARTQADERG